MSPFLHFIGAKDDGDGGDNWSYKMCKFTVKSSLQAGCLRIAPPTVSKHWWEKVSHSTDLLTPSSTGVFQSCLCLLKAPGYLDD